MRNLAVVKGIEIDRLTRCQEYRLEAEQDRIRQSRLQRINKIIVVSA